MRRGDRKLKAFSAVLREIFLRDIQNNSMFIRCIITITNMFLSNNGGLLKVYLNLFSLDGTRKESEILDFLNENKGMIRFKLGNALSNKFKFVPEIEFYIDDTLAASRNVNNLLKKIATDHKHGE